MSRSLFLPSRSRLPAPGAYVVRAVVEGEGAAARVVVRPLTLAR